MATVVRLKGAEVICKVFTMISGDDSVLLLYRIFFTPFFTAVYQSMTEAAFLTLGQSRSSCFKKIGLQPKA